MGSVIYNTKDQECLINEDMDMRNTVLIVQTPPQPVIYSNLTKKHTFHLQS